MAGLKATCSIGVFRKAIQSVYTLDDPKLAKEVFGLTFKNPIGLAAGFDKNAEYIEDLATFGFGFIEKEKGERYQPHSKDLPQCRRVPRQSAPY